MLDRDTHTHTKYITRRILTQIIANIEYKIKNREILQMNKQQTLIN